MDCNPNEVPIATACRALDVSRATLYRHTRPPKPRKPRTTPSPRRLSDPERQNVLEILHSPAFVDQPPTEVYATLLSNGHYVASIRTMYRILKATNETGERRRGHVARNYVKPQLVATAPNQVWTWDITVLLGPTAGCFYYLYTIIDLFSRYVVGWFVDTRQNAGLATHFIRETALRHHIAPGSLTLHSDRGTQMTAASMTALLARLEIGQSVSRPRVSDDNPFIESLFKTCKYQPDFPDRFGSPQHARDWCRPFFEWYNEEHHHEGLALYTPSEVFHRRIDSVAAKRQQALDLAYAKHPQRFVGGPPRAARPPTRVHINAPEEASSQREKKAMGNATKANNGCQLPSPLSAWRREDQRDTQSPARPKPIWVPSAVPESEGRRESLY